MHMDVCIGPPIDYISLKLSPSSHKSCELRALSLLSHIKHTVSLLSLSLNMSLYFSLFDSLLDWLCGFRRRENCEIYMNNLTEKGMGRGKWWVQKRLKD